MKNTLQGLPRWARIAAAGALVASAVGVSVAAPLHSFNAGDTLASGDLNANFAELEGRIADLQASVDDLQAKAHIPSAFRATRTSSFSVQPGTPAPILFDSELFDLDDEYSAATGTFTAHEAGTYLVECSVWVQTPATPSVWSIALVRNGTQLHASDWQNSAAKGLTPSASKILALQAGDQIRCTLYQDSASAQTINTAFPERTSFSAARLY